MTGNAGMGIPRRPCESNIGQSTLESFSDQHPNTASVKASTRTSYPPLYTFTTHIFLAYTSYHDCFLRSVNSQQDPPTKDRPVSQSGTNTVRSPIFHISSAHAAKIVLPGPSRARHSPHTWRLGGRRTAADSDRYRPSWAKHRCINTTRSGTCILSWHIHPVFPAPVYDATVSKHLTASCYCRGHQRCCKPAIRDY